MLFFTYTHKSTFKIIVMLKLTIYESYYILKKTV